MLLMTYLNNFFKLIICRLSQVSTTFSKSRCITSDLSPPKNLCILIFNIINLIKIHYSNYIKSIQIRRFIVLKKREIVNTFKIVKSRHNSFCNYTDEPEKWMLYFVTDKKLIQGKNCTFCGNYIRDGILYKNYCEKILCKCMHNKMVNYRNVNEDIDGYNFYCDLDNNI